MEQRKSIVVEDIEKVTADFFNVDYIREPLITNYRVNYKGQRFYARIFEHDDKNRFIRVAPSFSSISSKEIPKDPHLLKWMRSIGEDNYQFVMNNSANYGTWLHVLFGKILKGAEVYADRNWLFENLKKFYADENERLGESLYSFDEFKVWYAQQSKKSQARDIEKDVLGFICWTQHYRVVPLAIEYPLFDEVDNLYACTIDFIGKIYNLEDDTESIVLVDWKSGMSGFYDSNIFQVHAAKKLWDREFPDLQIKDVYLYGCKSYRIDTVDKWLNGNSKTAPFRFENVSDSEIVYKWDNYLKNFHGDSNNMKIESKKGFDRTKPLSMEITGDLHKIIQEESPMDYLKHLIDMEERIKEDG